MRGKSFDNAFTDLAVHRAALVDDVGHGIEVTWGETGGWVQVYTGDHLGAPHVPRAGLAIEAQLPPDAPNHPEWWGWAGTPIVRPGETWRHTTTFELSRTTR